MQPTLAKIVGSTQSINQTIERNERALFERALGEYDGIGYHDSIPANLWSKVKRFWSPTYSRAKKLVDFHAGIKTEMQMFDRFESIVRKEMNLASNQMGEAERAELARLIEEEIQDMAKVNSSLKEVWGEELGTIKALPVNEVQIYKLAKKIKGKNPAIDLQVAEWDMGSDLDRLENAIQQARVKAKLPERNLADPTREELQLRYQERTGKVIPYEGQYRSKLQVDSEVSYRVTDNETRHRQVASGTDSKGNTTYRTESYTVQVDHTVTPTYESIIEGRFRTGSHSTSSKLSEIRAATEQLRRTEVGVQAVHTQASELLFSFWDEAANAVTKKESIPTLSTIEKQLSQVKETRKFLDRYKDWSETEIRSQWADDNVSAFRARNEKIHQSMLNMEKLLAGVSEQIKRKESELYPTFQFADYSQELKVLRSKMIRDHVIKGVVASGAAGAGVYKYKTDKEVEASVDQFFNTVRKTVGIDSSY